MAKAGKGGIPITDKQLAAQWANAHHIFQLNVWNFEVLAGTAASHVFRQSFVMKHYNSDGAQGWKMTGKKNRSGKPQGGLIERGDLSQSITYDIKRKSGKSDTVRVYTNPKSFNSHFHKKYGDYFCYAAIHNEPPSSPLKTGHAASIAQRQFMPRPSDSSDSTVLSKKLMSLSAAIFMGMPGGKGNGFAGKINPTKYHWRKLI